MSLAKWFKDEERRLAASPEYEREMQLLAVADESHAVMKAQGVSRSELARRLDVRPSYVTKLLSGDANMTLETLMKVSQALAGRLSVMIGSYWSSESTVECVPAVESDDPYHDAAESFSPVSGADLEGCEYDIEAAIAA